jgi:hypothetical protein
MIVFVLDLDPQAMPAERRMFALAGTPIKSLQEPDADLDTN